MIKIIHYIGYFRCFKATTLNLLTKQIDIQFKINKNKLSPQSCHFNGLSNKENGEIRK